ncbi:MAG: hypothetical protein HIU81_05370 [Acidobacteria bacterium]|nr:hypothetical protein [Acidobacteriota bacterium]
MSKLDLTALDNFAVANGAATITGKGPAAAGSAEERVGHLRVDQVRSRVAGLPRLPHPRLTE